MFNLGYIRYRALTGILTFPLPKSIQKNNEILALQEENSRLRVELESLRIASEHSEEKDVAATSVSSRLSAVEDSSLAVALASSRAIDIAPAPAAVTPYIGMFNLWGYLFSPTEPPPPVTQNSRIMRV
jgi:hypothetical protein